MAKVSNFDRDLKGLFKVYFCNGRDGYFKEKVQWLLLLIIMVIQYIING